MDFILSRSDLLKNLQAVKNVIGTKNTNPILDNFLFDFTGDTLQVLGSDGETLMKATIPLETEGTGAYIIPSDKLVNTLKNLPEQPLSFSIKDHTLHITAENGNYTLSCIPGDEFPRPSEPEEPFVREIDGGVLSEGIHKTLFAVGNDEMRPMLNGILFHFTANKTNLVATDAHKLSRFTVKNINSDEELEFIVPKKPMQILRNVLDADIPVKMAFSQKMATFSFENTDITTTLISGKFPQYNQVIPKDNPFTMIVNREQFLNALRRASLYASKATNLVIISLKGSVMSIRARSEETSSEAVENLTVNYQGEDIEIGFNAKNLMEILSTLDGDDVEMSLSMPNRPVLVRPVEDSENEEVLMLLMPIAF